ncbi:hypothetical protein N657DRAFT_691424 [Parathielavia appendiculata]|uniref:Uncharacterized protein n=1 Tax=Parathielavia appendiculata TaxID=2587402 RepID=A0AAN6TWM9_9PEZI|nr:hypothetical protein N657DRAFT_691424 [Parathielavia appendiculata]
MARGSPRAGCRQTASASAAPTRTSSSSQRRLAALTERSTELQRRQRVTRASIFCSSRQSTQSPWRRQHKSTRDTYLTLHPDSLPDLAYALNTKREVHPFHTFALQMIWARSSCLALPSQPLKRRPIWYSCLPGRVRSGRGWIVSLSSARECSKERLMHLTLC